MSWLSDWFQKHVRRIMQMQTKNSYEGATMTDYYIRKADGVRVQAAPSESWPERMRVLPDWYVDWYPDGEAVLTPRTCPVCGQFVASQGGWGTLMEIRFLLHTTTRIPVAWCAGSGQVVPEDAPETPETAGHWLTQESFEEQYAPA